jgi:hypothetical protein
MAQTPWKLAECRKALDRHGLLMLQHERLPAVTTIVAGAPVKGSWWGHAEGHAIFNASQALEESKDVTVAKLIDGKVTYIHQRLWADLKAIGQAKEPWQLSGLSTRGQALLKVTEKTGSLRTDLATVLSRLPPKEIAKGALDLEKRLLVHSEEVHTESGAHAKLLTTWKEWAESADLPPGAPAAAEAQSRFEQIVDGLNTANHANAKLPWERGLLKRRR